MNLISLCKRHAKILRARRKIKRSLNSNAPTVFIYQMGKVASTSIYEALKERKDCHAFHAHLLGGKNLIARKRRVRDSFWSPDKRYRISNSFSSQIIQPRFPVKIITLVRDPFERNISAFFENADSVRATEKNEEQFIPELIKEYLGKAKHTQPEDWYKNEFHDALGIDIFQYPFDAETGWSTIEHGSYDVLILKTTLSDKEKAQQISSFLGIERLEIPRTNRTGEKALHTTYQRFKESIIFPEKIGLAMLQSQFTQHFFTQAEIDTMRLRWLQSTVK